MLKGTKQKNYEIGQRMWQTRMIAKLSERQLANMLNIPSSFIYDMENGNITISAEIICTYAKYFNKSADWFLDIQSNDEYNVIKYVSGIKNSEIKKYLLQMLLAIKDEV